MKLISVFIVSIIIMAGFVYGQDSHHIQDSINNSTLCKEKRKEFDTLRKRVAIKLDSVKSVLQSLQEKHPGIHYFIEERETAYFDWGECFYPRRTSSHGCDDCVYLNFRIREED